MTHRVPAVDPDLPALLIDIGNTTTTVATWQDQEVKTPLSAPTDNHEAVEEAIEAHCQAIPTGRPAATVIASVVPPALERLRTVILAKFDREALVVGETIPLPMDVGVDDVAAIGVDRVCAAAAAYDTLKTACVVVDFGTAVTADLVDDEGRLLGGAILPGLALQLRALHDYTAALPATNAVWPERPYGTNTIDAIRTGVCHGLAGAVRNIVEGFATYLNRWPQLVATGGDLEFMIPGCDFIDTTVRHLTVRGIGLAFRKHMNTPGT